jgi:hypothetical protein
MGDGDSIAKLIKQSQTTLASKGDPTQKFKEDYLKDLLSAVDSIRSAAKGSP